MFGYVKNAVNLEELPCFGGFVDDDLYRGIEQRWEIWDKMVKM